ncbi:allophanate hydrolase [Pseudomonas fluorescens]|uniref:Allophanate hydrolase n=1 Tax=Pseudomonas fluorescens TaxID=294 RepID=A0A327NDZ5_PSEFL|nr:allophanate hydrolase subunit 1 [Pseudomonas fluorescens]RAI72489.1 allophanate hydrolase [Pseudomonas fluorescens]
MTALSFNYGCGYAGCIETVAIDCLMVRLFNAISEDNVGWLQAATDKLRTAFASNLIDIVPSYTTVMVHFDLMSIDIQQARQMILSALHDLELSADAGGNLHCIPVWYDPSVGPDLITLAERSGLDQEEIIRRHCAKVYRVFALGFTPGFAFMGLVEPALAAPRLATPRQRIIAGSVGIGERQTAIYPSESPGGWNVIGRTPVLLFSEGQSLLAPGDSVSFEAIDRGRFIELGGNLAPLEGKP